MTGYHYTTLANWKKIKKEGLKPRLVEQHHLHTIRIAARDWSIQDFEGVWVWAKKPEGKSHLGNILRVVALHNSPRVVQLEINLDTVREFMVDGYREVNFYHHGSIGKWDYHLKDLGKIIIDPIPPEYITKIGEWDLLKLV